MEMKAVNVRDGTGSKQMMIASMKTTLMVKNLARMMMMIFLHLMDLNSVEINHCPVTL